MSESSGFVLLVVAALAALFAWFLFEQTPFAREVTVYQAWCPTARTKAGVCDSGEEAANPVTYEAMPSTQTVVYWFKGGAPTSLTHCAVRDASNWSCDQDAPYSLSMINGKLIYPIALSQPFYQVTMARWYSLWLHKKLK